MVGKWARLLTKSRKKRVLIRNDGVYVISGIFCGAHEARALWAKQREVSPVSNESCKRACERLRPEGLKWRAHGAKRSAQPRNTGPPKTARCEVADRRLRTVDANACKKVKARRAGVPSTRSAQARNTAQAKRRGARRPPPVAETGRSKPSKARSIASEPCERRRPRSGWSPEDTERSEVRRGGTQPRRRRGRCAATEHRASVSAERCVDKRPGNPR